MKRIRQWSGAVLMTGALIGLCARDARALDRGWFANLGAGLNHLDVASSIRTEPDIGYRLIATGGWQFNRNWGLELDSGLIRNTYSRSPHQTQRDNPLTQFPLVLNGIYSFADIYPIEPYLGAGGGVVLMSYRGSPAGGDAALTFKGGARYLFGERWGLGADYTFFMLGATSALVAEPVGCDTVNLTLHWMF